jgi:hypothetical protein
MYWYSELNYYQYILIKTKYMKNLLFVFFFVFVVKGLNAQNSQFTLNYESGTDFSVVATSALETPEGYLIASFDYQDVTTDIDTEIRLAEISKQGQLVRQHVLSTSPDSTLELSGLIDFGADILIVSTRKRRDPTSYAQDVHLIRYSKAQRRVVQNKTFKRFLFMTTSHLLMNKDSTIYLQGNFAVDTPSLRFFDNTIYFKLNKNLDILKEDTIYHRGYLHTTFAFRADSGRLYCKAYDTIQVRDTNFNLIYQFPSGSSFSSGYASGNYTSGLMVYRQKTILSLGTLRGNFPSLERENPYFEAINSQGRVVKSHFILLPNQRALPGLCGIRKPIDMASNGEIYLGHTMNINTSGFGLFGINNSPSRFLLHKLDTNFNIIYRKEYGTDDYYYLLAGILATSDGGCLMYGSRYDFNPTVKCDGYLIKVNANGDVTSETTIPLSTPTLKVFPNPAQAEIQVALPAEIETFDYRIYDSQGKLVQQENNVSFVQSINIQALATGSYMLQVWQKGRLLGVSQWVKTA